MKLWIFTTIKPRFCVKISSQIVDPQNTTVQGVQVLSEKGKLGVSRGFD